MFKTIFSVFVVLVNHKSDSVVRKTECGYKQCPQTRDGALNVHLIPHSHMDAGWVKTFDEYYHGTRTTISTANVQMIFHSVLSELLHDRRRKFTFSETAYFWRWWKEQRPSTRATFRSLVQEGRVEFAGGGWVQNDEATLHYLQIIDHFTWGLRKLNDTLGPCGKPKASWQIDTYGHSREQTSLLAQMGYDGLFIGRVDYAERVAMIEEDRMEFMWRGSDVLGKMSDIMTHSLYNLYNAPEGFCFDFLCSDEPIVDDPESKSYNVEKKVNEFLLQIERQAKYYDHDNIMVTMGGDFTYQSAANWYMNLDKLINHVNSHSGNISDVNVFYSTPSCYLKAIYLYGRRDKAIYTEKGDYFPYGSDASTYWTGYFTSRPALKYFIRKAHLFLQVVKQLTVIARMGDSYELHLLRHAANLVLHHDAVTGTSQQHVTNDFVRMLSEAIDSCTKKVSNLLGFLTPTWGGTRRSKNSQQFVVCHELNMSQCWFMENQDSIMLIVYNPLSVKTYHHVRLPAVALHYSIRDYNDEDIEYQLLPLPAAVINLPGRTSSVIQELYFEAENIPPLGYVSYHISPVRDILEENIKKHEQEKPPEQDKEVLNTISNEYLKVGVNRESGLLEFVQHLDGIKVAVSQNFYFYSQIQQTQQSGAYSFRPEKPRPTPVTQQVTFTVIRGNIVKEIRQRFSDWITQIIRLYRGEEFVELEWIIGPVPIGTDLGKEVVSIFNTNVSNSGQFYTDSNARQMMRRSCWNETATHQQKKLISACYYPVTSRICLTSRNTTCSFCVLTDRTQGGTSYSEGEIELMVHRRLLTDDGFGLEESLNEEEFGVGLVVRGKHRIIFGNSRQEIDDLTFSERVAAAARRWYMQPWPFVTAGDKISKRKWANVRNKRYSILRTHGLPRHVHVLTLEPWKGGAVLLRLENTLESPTRGRLKNEKYDGPEDFVTKMSHISVNLRQLFNQLQIRRVRETTLAANQWLDDARQMDWSSRYVYQGADDDLLPEDANEFKDDSRPGEEEKDSRGRGTYSDEESYKTKHSPTNVLRIKKRRPQRWRENYRKRRAVSAPDNILENTINGSFIDKYTEKTSNSKLDETTVQPSLPTLFNTNQDTTKIPVYISDFVPTVSEQFSSARVEQVTSATSARRVFDETFLRSSTPAWVDLRTVKNIEKIQQKNWKNMRRHQRVPPKIPQTTLDRGSEELMTSSEEELTDYGQKRNTKRRRLLGQSMRPGKPKDIGPDDGITKSIYEMYYKSRPRADSRAASGSAWREKARLKTRPRGDMYQTPAHHGDFQRGFRGEESHDDRRDRLHDIRDSNRDPSAEEKTRSYLERAIQMHLAKEQREKQMAKQQRKKVTEYQREEEIAQQQFKKEIKRQREQEIAQQRRQMEIENERRKEVKKERARKKQEYPDAVYRHELDYIHDKILTLTQRNKPNESEEKYDSTENRDVKQKSDKDVKYKLEDSAEEAGSGEEMGKKKMDQMYQGADVPFFITDSEGMSKDGERERDNRGTTVQQPKYKADSAEPRGSREEMGSKRRKKMRRKKYYHADVPFFVTERTTRIITEPVNISSKDLDYYTPFGNTGRRHDTSNERTQNAHTTKNEDGNQKAYKPADSAEASAEIRPKETGGSDHGNVPSFVKADSVGQGRARYAAGSSSTEQAVYRATISPNWDHEKSKAPRSDPDFEVDRDGGMDFYDHDHEYEPTRRRKRKVLAVEEIPDATDGAAGPGEAEFIITLRPTQIRTFIIYFESSAKSSRV